MRPRSPTAYGPWKSHATPLDVAMPMWPMNGKNIVMGGRGDHSMLKARGWRFSAVWLESTMHATSSWWLEDSAAIVSKDDDGRCRCILGCVT